MTKTRIVIKKVKAKRAPKRFKVGMKILIKRHEVRMTQTISQIKRYDG